MSPKNRRYSDDERQRIFDAQNRVLDRIEQKRQAITSRYRRDIIFRIPFAVRFLFLAFFAWLYFFPNDWGETTLETITAYEHGLFLKSKQVTVNKVEFTTDRGSYSAHFENHSGPSLFPGEQVLIYHNVFGKPSFFGPNGTTAHIELWINWIMLALIGLLTLISFTFTELDDSWTVKIHWLTWVANLFAFGYYFIAC